MAPRRGGAAAVERGATILLRGAAAPRVEWAVMATGGIGRGASRGWIGAAEGSSGASSLRRRGRPSGPRGGEAVLMEAGSPVGSPWGAPRRSRPAGAARRGIAGRARCRWRCSTRACGRAGQATCTPWGSGGRALHVDGRSWGAGGDRRDQWLASVWGSGADNVYAVGGAGAIVRRQGGKWTKEESGTTGSLEAVWGSGPKDVFAVGSGGTALHFDGREWSPQAERAPPRRTFRPSGGAGRRTCMGWGGNRGYEAGGAVVPAAAIGSSWEELPAPGKSLCGVWGSGPDAVWMRGRGRAQSRGALAKVGGEWKAERVPTAGSALALSGVSGKPVLLAALNRAEDKPDDLHTRTALVIEQQGNLWERRDLDHLVPHGGTRWGFSGTSRARRSWGAGGESWGTW